MLFTQRNITQSLNIWLVYGLRASGKLRADRYNIYANSWDSKNAETVCKNFEKITGLHVATYSFNAEKNNHAKPFITQHIYYAGNVSIPIRFPAVNNDVTDIMKG